MYYGGGIPSVSLAGYASVSDASNLKALEGYSLSVGASGGDGAVFGGEVTFMQDTGKGDMKTAKTFLMGIGVGCPVEMHAVYGRTEVVSFNYLDLLLEGCDYVLQQNTR